MSLTMEPAGDRVSKWPIDRGFELPRSVGRGAEGFLGGDGVKITDNPEIHMSSSASSQENTQGRIQALWRPELVQFRGPCCRL